MLTLLKHIGIYAIYLGGIFIFFLSLTGRVKYAILFLTFLLPLQNVFIKIQQFPLGKDFNDILFIGMVIGWVLYRFSSKKVIFERSSYNKILFLYFIFTYFSLWHGSYHWGYPLPLSASDIRVQNWKNYMLLPLLFFIVFNNLQNRKDIKRLFMIMCLSMIVMSYYTVQQIKWIGSWMSRVKLHGTFVWLGPNEVAAFYATYTFVLVGIFLLVREKKWKIFLALLILLNLYCNLFLFSRGAYLATLMGFLIISIIRKKKLIFPIILLLIFWKTVLPQQVVERIEFTEQEEGRLDPSVEKRLLYWRESVKYFAQNPLIGVGFNTLQYKGLKRDTHNVYLRTLAEEGLVGFIFFLTILILAFKRGWRLYKNSQEFFLKGLGLGFCACVMAVMVGNFFGDRWTYIQLGSYFWIFLGMVERANIIVTEKLKSINL